MTDYKIEFQEEGHLYTVNNRPVLSVTQVLPYNYVNNNDYNMERGTLAHKMLFLYNMGDLDEKSLDPILCPYLEAYKRFRAECSHIKGVIE